MNGNNSTWLRFFLEAAAHNSIPDPDFPGLDKQGTNNSSVLPTFSQWAQKSNILTIEHIVPQKPGTNSDYDASLLHPDSMHSLGDLTLIPRQVNTSLGNRFWSVKRNIYDSLSQSDPSERIRLLNERIPDLQLRKNTKEIILNADYLQSLRSLSQVDNWTPDLIRARAIRLTELAWNNIKDNLIL